MLKASKTFNRYIHQWPPKKTVETIIKEAPARTKFFMDKKSKEFISALADEIIEKINQEVEKEKTFTKMEIESPKMGKS